MEKSRISCRRRQYCGVVIMVFEKVNSPSCVLGENPVWYKSTSEFFWTDILNGIIYAYSIRNKRWRTVIKTPYLIGAFLETNENGLVIFTEKGVFNARKSGSDFLPDKTPIWTVPFDKGERFNDAIADPYGAVISGSKREDNTNGKLYRFVYGKEPEILLTGLGITNGMGFSPDGKTFYHTDSLRSTITAYDYAPDLPLKNPRTVIRLDVNIDPDGMTVDSEGCLWTCCWGAGKIIRFSPEGILLDKFPVDAIQCSSLCFGGDSLQEIFVTSASIGSDGTSKLGGECFYARSSYCGKPEYLANIP